MPPKKRIATGRSAEPASRVASGAAVGDAGPTGAGAVGVSVVVPWRPTAEREQLWSLLRPQWEALRYEVIEGTCPEDGPWNKGIAVGDGIERASHDLIVVADADVWCDGVPAAVNAVNEGKAQWAIPHHLVKRLTPPATDEVLATGDWPRVRTSFTYADRPYIGHPGGGVVVLTRATWETAPLDPRFAGWGQEDNSWALALRLLCGREWRGVEDLWHLWHAPQSRMNRTTGSSAGASLYRRYWAARNSVRTMTALIAETRPARVG